MPSASATTSGLHGVTDPVTCHAVDVRWAQARVVERAAIGAQCQRERADPGVLAVRSRPDTGDGRTITERVRGHRASIDRLASFRSGRPADRDITKLRSRSTTTVRVPGITAVVCSPCTKAGPSNENPTGS